MILFRQDMKSVVRMLFVKSGDDLTISFRAGEILAAELAAKPLGQPSAEPLTGEIMTRAKVFLDNETISALINLL